MFPLRYLFFLNINSLQAVTINANAWTNAGHAVNQVYDILYMMDRDDIPVGVGGEGGILTDGTILPNVGGYLPIIEQVHENPGIVCRESCHAYSVKLGHNLLEYFCLSHC